jgi:hypothetical protein
VLLYGLSTALELKATAGKALVAAVHRRDFHEDSQWRVADALPNFGIRNEDAVAVIHGTEASFRCHWAYVAHVRIVAEFGGLPWKLEPWDRTRFDDRAAELADEDYGRIFWEKLTPQQRGMVVDLFRSTGARAIVSLSRPSSAPEAGWQPIPGTQTMIYRFDPQ